MASPPSRIPVPAQHSRIPVLAPALDSAHSSRSTTSSSTPFRAARAVSDATYPAASTSTGSATYHLGEVGVLPGMWNSSSAEDQAWGKIERLRTRRVFSEGTADLAESPISFSDTVRQEHATFNGTRPFSPGARRNTDATAAERRERIHRPIPDTVQLISMSSRPMTELPQGVTSSQRDTQHTIRQGSKSPDFRNRSLPSEPSAMLSRPTRDRRRMPFGDAVVGNTGGLSGSPADSPAHSSDQEPKNRTKLVSNVSINGWGMLALGFEDADRKISQSVEPVVTEPKVDLGRRSSKAETVEIVSSTGTDGGEPIPRVSRADASDEDVRAQAAGAVTTERSGLSTQPRRRAFDIPRALPSSVDNVAAERTESSRTAAFVQGLVSNPPDLPGMLDANPSDSSSSLRSSVGREYLATTAEKRHQPQLRLVSMPNIPSLRAPGIHQPFGRSGSGASPPIPPKSPLRQPSSFGTTSSSHGTTSTISGFLTPNSVYATPSEIPGIPILDRPSETPHPPEAQASNSTVMPLEPKRKETGRSRPEGFYLASSNTVDIYQQFYIHGHGKSPKTADTVAATDDVVHGGVGQLQSALNISSNKAPSKRLPDPPLDDSPATSSFSPDISRLDDIREAFPASTFIHDSAIPKISQSDHMAFDPSKSPSGPSLKLKEKLAIDVHRAKMDEGRSSSATSSRPNTLHARSRSNPSSPAAAASSPGNLSASGSSRMSKRSHLINEILETERAYAYDLALVRDAYLYRLRPSSQHSTISTGPSKNGRLSPDSRHTAHTFETTVTSATSFDNPARLNSGVNIAGLTESSIGANSDSGRASSMSMTSNKPSSLAEKGKSAEAFHARESAVPRPSDILSHADIKAIFLNIEQLAAFSSQLATSFENALEDASASKPSIAENAVTDEVVVDKLGAVFHAAIPQIRSLYTYYCSRSGQANLRLAELMRDRAHARALNACWETIQPFTHSWDLASMLIKPVQRIMKYPMLFKELLAATTPAHPDYFNLRQAAASASAVADEINEAKRRKELVENAISGANGIKNSNVTSPTTSVNKETRLSFKLAKRFGKNKEKDKEKGRSSPVVGSLSHLSISPSSEAEVTMLIRRLESSRTCVQHVGEEIERFPELIRHQSFQMIAVATAWHQAYTLDATDMIDRRLQVYRNMMELILKYPYVKLNKDIKYEVLPILETIRSITSNPLAVTNRMLSKRGDYNKVQIARRLHDVKNLDAEILQNAEDYASLHAQLLEELPLFLRGMDKLMEILLGAFSLAQKDYFNGMQAHIRRFFYTVKLPVWGDEKDTGDADSSERPEGGSGSVPDGESIMKLWNDAWKPEHSGLRSLGLVSNTGPLYFDSRNQSQEVVGRRTEAATANKSLRLNAGNALRAPLSRNTSFTSTFSKANRTRSPSLVAPKAENTHLHSVDSAALASRPYLGRSRTQGTSTANGTTSTNVQQALDLAWRQVSPRDEAALSTEQKRPPLNQQHGPGSGVPNRSEGSVDPSPVYQTRQNDTSAIIPVANWSQATHLYRCVCVADFQVASHIRYATLPFLTLEKDEAIDILYEVGRVDDFTDLPISVGVDDDGLLVGRSSDRRVGLILCSFLEPMGTRH